MESEVLSNPGIFQSIPPTGPTAAQKFFLNKPVPSEKIFVPGIDLITRSGPFRPRPKTQGISRKL